MKKILPNLVDKWPVVLWKWLKEHARSPWAGEDAFPQVPTKWLVAYISLAVTLATISSYATYRLFASAAWICWSGEGAWIRDALRAISIGLITFLLLRKFQVTRKGKPRADKPWFIFPRGIWEYVLLVVVFFLPLAALPMQVNSFVDGLKSHKDCPLINPANYNREILVPYAPYILYIYAVWIVPGIPVLLVLTRWVYRDRKEGRRLRQELRAIAEIDGQENQSSETKFESLVASHQTYVAWLMEVAERYLSILVLISIALLHEQLTPIRATSTEATQQIMKILPWLFLGPALTGFVAFVARGYQKSVENLQRAFGDLAVTLAKQGGHSSMFDRVSAAHEQLIWDHSTIVFIGNVLTRAGIPLIIAIAAYVIKVLVQDEWIWIFIPRPIWELIKRIYLA